MPHRWPSTNTSFLMDVLFGTTWNKTPSCRRQCCGGPEDLASIPWQGRHRIRRDQPVRRRPSRASADLWSRRRTTGGARPAWEGSARLPRRCRRWAAPCPRNRTRDWTQHPEHSLCTHCAAEFRSLPCHTRCPPQRTRTAPLRRLRQRSCDARFTLRRKAYIARHMRCLQANAVVRPFLWQVERTIDEGMAMPRHIASEYANLAIGDFACRASVLTCHPARRLTLLQKAGLIDHQNRVFIAKRFQCVLSYDVA